jgi:hypothetical protein
VVSSGWKRRNSVSALRKPTHQEPAKHPARPATGPLDVKAAYARIAKRYPKILAKLGE